MSDSANSNAPSDTVQQALAGAFIAIKVGNRAISLQPPLPAISVTGLENVNTDLATAQDHAKYWTGTLSQNVQNQLQAVVDYNSLYAPLASTINGYISTIKNTKSGDPAPTDAMTNLAACFQALQGQVQQLLYGTGGDQSNPAANSAMGTYNALIAYQSNVAGDKKTFDNYAQIAFNDQSGISVQIKQYQSDIDTDNTAIAKDQAMIGGGAAMIVTGVLICVVAVALAPETGGATIAAIGVLGVGTIAGGAVMIGVAAHDLEAKQADVVAKTKAIAADQTELAGLKSINTSSTAIAAQAANIYGALDTILTSWQQMDNELSDVIAALNMPEQELMKWIQNKSGQNPTYQVMGTILGAQFGTADTDWAKASATATTLLNGLANVVEFTMPPGSDVSANSIAAAGAAAKKQAA